MRVQMEVPFEDIMAHFVNQRTPSGVISPNAVLDNSRVANQKELSMCR